MGNNDDAAAKERARQDRLKADEETARRRHAEREAEREAAQRRKDAERNNPQVK